MTQDNQNIFQVYEAEKKKLQETCGDEYERKVKELADRLGI